MLKIKTSNCDKKYNKTSLIITPKNNNFKVKLYEDIENLKDEIYLKIFSESELSISQQNNSVSNTNINNKKIIIKIDKINNYVELKSNSIGNLNDIIIKKIKKSDIIIEKKKDLIKEENTIKIKEIAVITANIGNYDKEISQIDFIENNDYFDWYYFTDNLEIKSSDWKIITSDYTEINKVNIDYYANINMMKAKYYKINMFQINILSKYKYIIWIDSSVKLCNKNFINDIIKIITENKNILYNFEHKNKKNLVDEYKESIEHKKYHSQNLKLQIDNYYGEGFKDKIVYECGIFIVKNDILSKKILKEWWEEIIKYSFQDQLSYPYVLWKNNIEPYILNGSEFIKGYSNGSVWKNKLFGEVYGHNFVRNNIVINKSSNKMINLNIKNILNNLIDWTYYIQYNIFCVNIHIENIIEYFLEDGIKNKNINLRLNTNFKLKNEDNKIEIINQIKKIINRCVVKNKNENFFIEILKISKDNNIKLIENIPHYEFMEVKVKEKKNEEHKFCIIIPSYNNEKNIRNNLISVFYQNYKNYKIIYTNDNSQDKTEELFNEVIKEFGVEDIVIYKKNSVHSFQSYSKYQSYQMVDDNDIVVILDGDDWLSKNNVLETVSEYYNKTGCKVTYSNFLMYESENKNEIIKSKEYPDYVKKIGSYRKYSQWLFFHLRTGYGNLFKNIPENYLKYDGKWLDRVTDQAEMFCVAEMAGDKVLHIDEVLHIYNKANSLLYHNSHYNDEYSKIRKQIENYIKNILEPIKIR